MNLSIRPYEELDFDAVTSIWLAGWKFYALPTFDPSNTLDYLRERLPREISKGWAVYVAIVSSQVVGFIALHEDKLEQLFIAPAMQGNGIGKVLLSFAKNQKPEGFWLTTAVANDGSNRFYEREGLKRGEVTRHSQHGYPIVRFDWVP